MMVSFNLRNIFTHIVCAFVALGTMFYVPLSNANPQQAIEFGYQSQELFFRYGTFGILALSMLLEPLRKSDISKFVLFFICALVFGLFNGFDVNIRRAVLNMACALIFFKVTADNISFVDFKAVCFWMLAVVILNLVMCIQQATKTDPLFSMPATLGPKDAMVGFMRLKVHLGTLLAVISPMVFYLNPLLAFIAVPMLCVANSSAAVSAYIASMGLLLFLRLKKIHAVILFIAILAGGVFYVYKFDLPGGQFGKRFNVWNAVYSLTLKGNPIFGSGAGSYAKLNVTTMQDNGEPEAWLWTHNEYIQAFYEFGIVGLSFILFYVKDCFSNFRKFIKDSKIQVLFASVLSVFIISVLHFPFHLSRLAIPCLFVMALFQARVKDIKC